MTTTNILALTSCALTSFMSRQWRIALRQSTYLNSDCLMPSRMRIPSEAPEQQSKAILSDIQDRRKMASFDFHIAWHYR